jgi:hypothetical protein
MTDQGTARALLSDMIRVRRMEEKCAELKRSPPDH